jgi:hypothetical protein
MMQEKEHAAVGWGAGDYENWTGMMARIDADRDAMVSRSEFTEDCGDKFAKMDRNEDDMLIPAERGIGTTF